MLKHNKKRNIGLLNEFFARYMATAAVEFRFDDYEKADVLWKKHFCKGSELVKELALFESIAGVCLKDRAVAYQMLVEAQQHTKQQNFDKLEQEKTALLHEINSQLNDPKFFSQAVQNYRSAATIQILLNTWHSRPAIQAQNFSQLSQVKEKVIDFMTEAREELPPIDASILSKTKEDVDQLVVNVFSEKVNERYSEQLNDRQKEILGLYVFANNSEASQKKLVGALTDLRSSVSETIELELRGSKQNSVKEKLHEVRGCLQDSTYDVSRLSADTISFYLAIAGLKQELESE